MARRWLINMALLCFILTSLRGASADTHDESIGVADVSDPIFEEPGRGNPTPYRDVEEIVAVISDRVEPLILTAVITVPLTLVFFWKREPIYGASSGLMWLISGGFYLSKSSSSKNVSFIFLVAGISMFYLAYKDYEEEIEEE